MSTARLDDVLDRLVALAGDRDDLEPWLTVPVDEAVLEQLVSDAAPWRFAEEHLHMARRHGFFPGYLCWGVLLEDGAPPSIQAQMSWQSDIRQSAPNPQEQPTVKWVEYASEERYFSVVPLLTAPTEQAPIAFTEGVDSIDIVFPSLTALLESFAVCIEIYDRHYGDEAPVFEEDDGFDSFWWAMVGEPPVDGAPEATRSIQRRLLEINAPDQSDHPVWTRLARNVTFNDPKLLWP